MSNATQTQPLFGAAAARVLPTLACIGKVVSVGAPTLTKPNPETGIQYVMYNIGIQGFGASRNSKVNFMIRPEWLVPGFDPGSFESIDGGKGLEFMYGRHIARRGDVSTLQGLVGCDDTTFAAFCEKLATANGDPAAIGVALSDFLIEEGNGALVGYILRQQQEKAGVDEETGKNLYVGTQYYEVNSYFTPNEKGRKRQYDKAKTGTGSAFKVQFTEDDVEA